jgi:hypothetical protein
MFCTNCGVELPANARFCIECGTHADVEAAPVAATPQVRRNRVKWVVSGAIALLVAAVGGGYLYANRLAKSKVDEVIASLEGKVGLTYGDVGTNILSQSVTLSDIRITSLEGKPVDGVTIKSLSVAGNPKQDADPQELDVRIEKLTIDLAQMGPEGAKWIALGFGPVVLDALVDYRFSRSTGEFDLNRLEIAGQDLMTVGVSLHLGDIDPQVEFPEEALSQPTVTVRGGEFVIKDAVIIERFIDGLAEKEGVSPVAYRQRLTEITKAMVGGGSSGSGDGVSAAVVRLINEPRSTHRISIAPHVPVSLGALKQAGDPGRAITMLNVQVGS